MDVHELPRDLTVVQNALVAVDIAQERIERAHALRVAAFERCHSFFETMREMRSNGRIRSVPRESAYTANVSPRRKSTLFTTCTRYWKSDRSSFRPSLCWPIAWRTARGMLVNRRLLRSEVTLSNE